MTELTRTCAMCQREAVRACPRCDNPVCNEHGDRPHGACGECVRGLSERSRVGTASRVAVAASAAVAGMVGGALAVMLVASALGLSPEIIILLMLVAELGCGAVTAYAADRKMQSWLQERAKLQTADLPRARLVSRETES